MTALAQIPTLKFRICKICGQKKPADLENFYKHNTCRDGLGIYCKPCQHEKLKQWRKDNADRHYGKRRQKWKDGYRERQKTLREQRAARIPFLHTAESMVQNIVQRSRKKGLQVCDDLRNKHFIAAWLERQQKCECCGVDFMLGPKGTVNDRSPSVDRMDPDQGYVLSNASLICWRCNNIKRRFSSAEIRRVADWIDGRASAVRREDRDVIFAACRAQSGPWIDRTLLDRREERSVGAIRDDAA